MKFILFLFIFFLPLSSARAYVSLDLNEACAPDFDRPESLDAYCALPPHQRNWTLGLSFGPFVASYWETSLKLKRNNQTIVLGKITPEQRTSFSYYKIVGNQNPAQVFDEPQNRITLSYQSKTHGLEAGIEYVHPKILFLQSQDDHNLGTAIDPVYLQAVQTTKLNIMLDLYVLKRFELSERNRKVRLVYGAGGGLGIHGSSSVFCYQDKNGIIHPDPESWKMHGAELTLQNRFDVEFQNSRVSARFGHDLVYLHYDTQQGDTRLTTHVFGQFFTAQMGFKIIRDRKPILKRIE